MFTLIDNTKQIFKEKIVFVSFNDIVFIKKTDSRAKIKPWRSQF